MPGNYIGERANQLMHARSCISKSSLPSIRRSKAFCILLLLLSIPHLANACEPMVPLVMLFGGTTFIGQSIAAFAAAIAIKCLAFSIFERRLNWFAAFAMMLVANVFSTIIGMLLCIGVITPPLILFSLAATYAVSILPAGRFKAAFPNSILSRHSKAGIAGIIMLLFFFTIVLFMLAQGVLESTEALPLGRNLALYWLSKFAYVYAALIISIFLTTLWEESVIGAIAFKKYPGASYMKAVLSANLITLLAIMLYAAIKILPQRMHSPTFLVQLWK